MQANANLFNLLLLPFKQYSWFIKWKSFKMMTGGAPLKTNFSMWSDIHPSFEIFYLRYFIDFIISKYFDPHCAGVSHPRRPGTYGFRAHRPNNGPAVLIREASNSCIYPLPASLHFSSPFWSNLKRKPSKFAFRPPPTWTFHCCNHDRWQLKKSVLQDLTTKLWPF